MTMDTQPMPLEALAATHGGLGEFRIGTPFEIRALLQQLQDGNVVLHLNTPQGTSFGTTLWAVDSARNKLSLTADGLNPQMEAVLESDEVTAVGYLDSVKVQFELHDTMIVHSGRHSALTATLPREVFRFQRRSGYRVRPPVRQAPTAYFPHPMIPEMGLALRVLDLSIGGCALFLPDDVPELAPGVRINGVQLELDASTNLRAGLIIHHVTAINPEARGVRLGCELVGLAPEASRALQVFIDLTQKRRRQFTFD